MQNNNLFVPRKNLFVQNKNLFVQNRNSFVQYNDLFLLYKVLFGWKTTYSLYGFAPAVVSEALPSACSTLTGYNILAARYDRIAF
jgi:hypothetical protein